MKFTAMIFCALVLITDTGCIKELLDKKKEDDPQEQTNKYIAVWKLTGGAVDQDGDMVLDASERTGISGTSELNLKKDFIYTYFLTVSGSSQNMSGAWKMGTDNKSLSISDASGSIRFDIRSDNELHTEPIVSNGSTVWLIYTR